VNKSTVVREYILTLALLKNLASMAIYIISAPEYKIWSINGLSTVNNRYVDEKLGIPFTQIKLLRNFKK
jgi:hypothetical protein